MRLDLREEIILYKFIKTKEEGDRFVNSSVTFELDKDASLEDMLEEFGYFLKACGYRVEGDVIIESIDNETKVSEESDFTEEIRYQIDHDGVLSKVVSVSLDE